MSAIQKGDTVETIDKRCREPRVDVRRVVGFITGPTGAIQKVLYTVNDRLPAQSATPAVWQRWKQDEDRRKHPQAKARSRPGYLTLPIKAAITDDDVPAGVETRDVLLVPVQRVCANRHCRCVFKTRVVSVHHCPKCAAAMAPTAMGREAAKEAANKDSEQGAAE